jgi:hypothetical protein
VSRQDHSVGVHRRCHGECELVATRAQSYICFSVEALASVRTKLACVNPPSVGLHALFGWQNRMQKRSESTVGIALPSFRRGLIRIFVGGHWRRRYIGERHIFG